VIKNESFAVYDAFNTIEKKITDAKPGELEIYAVRDNPKYAKEWEEIRRLEKQVDTTARGVSNALAGSLQKQGLPANEETDTLRDKIMYQLVEESRSKAAPPPSLNSGVTLTPTATRTAPPNVVTNSALSP
jgi:hypothetical protein